MRLLHGAAGPDDGASRPDSGDHDVERRGPLLARLLDGFAAEPLLRLDTRLVVELIEQEPAGALCGVDARPADGADDPLRLGCQDETRAVRTDHRLALVRHVFGHEDDRTQSEARRPVRQGDAGVAGGRLDDLAAVPERPVAEALLQDEPGDAVLDAAARVQVLELHPHAVQVDERRPQRLRRDAGGAFPGGHAGSVPSALLNGQDEGAVLR